VARALRSRYVTNSLEVRLWVNGLADVCVCIQVVDKCVGCPQGGLDLWAPAFAELAPLGVGVLSASWEFVGC
jgi:hypothetical protein